MPNLDITKASEYDTRYKEIKCEVVALDNKLLYELLQKNIPRFIEFCQHRGNFIDRFEWTPADSYRLYFYELLDRVGIQEMDNMGTTPLPRPYRHILFKPTGKLNLSDLKRNLQYPYTSYLEIVQFGDERYCILSSKKQTLQDNVGISGLLLDPHTLNKESVAELRRYFQMLGMKEFLIWGYTHEELIAPFIEHLKFSSAVPSHYWINHPSPLYFICINQLKQQDGVPTPVKNIREGLEQLVVELTTWAEKEGKSSFLVQNGIIQLKHMVKFTRPSDFDDKFSGIIFF